MVCDDVKVEVDAGGDGGSFGCIGGLVEVLCVCETFVLFVFSFDDCGDE